MTEAKSDEGKEWPWGKQHSPSSYLLVVYPSWVRWLQWVREKVSKAVWRCEMRTARFYNPETGEEIKK